MSTDNVFPFPGPSAGSCNMADGGQPRSKRSGSSDRAAELRRRFRDLGRAQPETFAHLARHVSGLVEELKARYGTRSGKMERAFGHDLIKQKQRFVQPGAANVGRLSQNPGHWITILDGLAAELGLDPHRAFLNAVDGSALMPRPDGAGLSREAWLSGFRDLMRRMLETLTAAHDYPALETMLADSGLVMEAGRLEVCERNDPAIGIDEHGIYLPWVLLAMPHVMGINYRGWSGQPIEAQDLPALLEASGADPHMADGAPVATLRGGVRTALALVIDETTQAPTFALAEWEVCEIEIIDGRSAGQVHLHYGSYESLSMEPPAQPIGGPNSVRFHFLGSPGFDALAASRIVWPDIVSDREDFELWDPCSYMPTPDEHPTDAPARTVAAVIERNLLYAPSDQPERRIDRSLLRQLATLQRLLDEHREAVRQLAQHARKELDHEWGPVGTPERDGC